MCITHSAKARIYCPLFSGRSTRRAFLNKTLKTSSSRSVSYGQGFTEKRADSPRTTFSQVRRGTTANQLQQNAQSARRRCICEAYIGSIHRHRTGPQDSCSISDISPLMFRNTPDFKFKVRRCQKRTQPTDEVDTEVIPQLSVCCFHRNFASLAKFPQFSPNSCC